MSDADDFMTRYLNNITSQYESSRFKPEYEPAEPETTKVTCRDGVELTVDIFRPATPGPYPTIVVRCPYPQQVELWKLHGEHLNRRGYAMVCEWCRAPTPPAARGNRTSTSATTVRPARLVRTSGLDRRDRPVGHLVPVPDLLDRGGHHHAEGGLHLRQPLRHRPVRLRLPKGLLPLRRAHRLGHAERRISGRRRLHEIRPPPAADERGRGHVGRPP